jgi:hypothetical protein
VHVIGADALDEVSKGLAEATGPSPGTNQQRRDLCARPGPTLQLDVVDSPAAMLIGVEELVVEQAKPQIQLCADRTHPDP